MPSKRKKVFWIVGVFAAVAIVGWIEWTHRIPWNSVLEIDLTGQIEEQRPESASSVVSGLFSGDILVLHELTDAVDAARDDKRVAGLIVRIGDVGAGWAKIQELSEHIAAFRKSGKPSLCLLEEDYNDNRAYNIASACDQVWMLPSATLGITGMMTESTFYRGALDKLGVKAEFARIAEYKTYVNMYTEKKYTPAQREMDESLMTSTLGQYVASIAAARHIAPVKVEEFLRGGPYTSDEATDIQLVDKAGYWDEIEDYFDKKLGEDNWSTIELADYTKEIKNTGTESIAVVYATGEVDSGESDWNPWSGFVLGADTVAEEIRSARDNEKIKAIILRVDSPGGSVSATDEIRREVENSAGQKPVVVSMSDEAGSGGYWMALPASRIVADPATLTGSIGVFFGKFDVAGLYSLLGVSTDHVASSENATLLWDQQDFTPAQRAMVNKMIEDSYSDFTSDVAGARHLSEDAVDEIARGRVWTGEQAKKVGLVDEVGGFDAALALARQLAKIDPRAQVRLVRLPEETPWWRAWLSRAEIFESGAQQSKSQSGQDGFLAGITRQLRRMARANGHVQARMPMGLKVR
jgi:protease-4